MGSAGVRPGELAEMVEDVTSSVNETDRLRYRSMLWDMDEADRLAAINLVYANKTASEEEHNDVLETALESMRTLLAEVARLGRVVERREAAEAQARHRRQGVLKRLLAAERRDYRNLHLAARDEDKADYAPAIMARILRRRSGRVSSVDEVIIHLANELDISDEDAERLTKEGFALIGAFDRVGIADVDHLQFPDDRLTPGLNGVVMAEYADEMVMVEARGGTLPMHMPGPPNDEDKWDGYEEF